jgi:hypothetical protein
MRYSFPIIASVVFVLVGTLNIKTQNLEQFCKELTVALSEAKTAHPGWPFLESYRPDSCLIRVEEHVYTDAKRLLQVFVTTARSTEGAIELVDEYRSRIRRVVSDRKKYNAKLVNKKAGIVELGTQVNGWQNLLRWDYGTKESVIFGRRGQLYVQITFDEFPYIERVQDFLLSYQFSR